jgi:hypothetical protein
MIVSNGKRWAEYVARLGENKIAHGVLVGKLEGERPLGEHKRRNENYKWILKK